MKVPMGGGTLFFRLDVGDYTLSEGWDGLSQWTRGRFVSLLQKELCKKSRYWVLPAPFNDQELFLGTLIPMPCLLHPSNGWRLPKKMVRRGLQLHLTEKKSKKAQHTGHVFESVSNQDSIGVLRVIPLQVDGLQVGLSDSETPWGTGYLGKEEGARR